MKKAKKCIFLFTITLSCLIACTQETKQLAEATQEEKLYVNDTSWKKLSLREKIGQVMCMNYQRAQILSVGEGSTLRYFEKYPIGSFFLANWELDAYATKNKLADEYRTTVTDLTLASKYPLLLSEDFETGVGSTLPQYTELTNAMGLAATNSEEMAKVYAEILSKEARSIGINWILNPVVDLNINPFNFLTNVRSMGGDSELVQRIALSQAITMQDNGVGATIKHFPGDGTDFLNQHFTTSQMKLSVSEWEKSFGKIFKTAIDKDVMCIMPGHISFPAYQKEKLNGEYLPATLSKELLTDLLKGKMKFQGVIISDALNMAGIANYYENQLETEIECFKAGTDLLLWPTLAFMDSLEARIIRKEIPIERLDDAVNRVWNMKKKLGLFKKDYQVIEPLQKIDIAKHGEQAYQIAKASITAISNKNDVIPICSKKHPKILIIVTSTSDQSSKLSGLKNGLISKGFKVDIRHNLSVFAHQAEFPKIIAEYDRVIFAFYSYPGMPWGSLSLAGEAALTMWSANKLPLNKVISIGFGDPYKNLIYMPRIWTRLNCYGTSTATQKALVDVLTGESIPTGISPVSLEGKHNQKIISKSYF